MLWCPTITGHPLVKAWGFVTRDTPRIAAYGRGPSVSFSQTITFFSDFLFIVFTCVSYAEAHNRYRLDVRLSVCLSVRPSVRHTLAPYQNG